jgi:GTP cyclohydrolase II
MNIIQSNIANLPSKNGNFRIKAYKDDNQEHLAIMSENFENLDEPYIRVHSECLTGDALGSLKCDCQGQLDIALKFIAREGGLVIYHRQEGRNIGLVNKINAYNLQDQGRNTIQANVELGFGEDDRDYRIVKHIFEDLGIKKLKLITNNPKKIEYIESLGVDIVERIPAITKANKYNKGYINTKKEQMGHMF